MVTSVVRALSCVSVLTLITLAGCDSGPAMGTVKGKVTLDGAPVKDLQVNFAPKDAAAGTSAVGYTEADGTYQLSYPGDKKGAPVGEYRVTIVPAEIDDVTAVRPVIPPKYNVQSELSKTVAKGENTFDFELTSK